MIKTKYAVEQYKGWWYALKCTTLFGITIWTEYINEYGLYTYSSREGLLSISLTSKESALNVIECYKAHINQEDEFSSKNTKKMWIQ